MMIIIIIHHMLGPSIYPVFNPEPPNGVVQT